MIGDVPSDPVAGPRPHTPRCLDETVSLRSIWLAIVSYCGASSINSRGKTRLLTVLKIIKYYSKVLYASVLELSRDHKKSETCDPACGHSIDRLPFLLVYFGHVTRKHHQITQLLMFYMCCDCFSMCSIFALYSFLYKCPYIPIFYSRPEYGFRC